MEIKFFKYQALGNDFIIVDDLATETKLSEDAIRTLCDRHFGVGADGVILVRPADSRAEAVSKKQAPQGERDNFLMLYYNADGSSAAVCGNGLRCVAKFLYDERLSLRKTLRIGTLEGAKDVNLLLEDNQVKEIRVDMGKPRFKPSEIPMKVEGEKVLNQKIEVNSEQVEVTCLSMGNPHCVIFVEEEDQAFFEAIGPALENHPLFPERTNVEFARVIDSKTLKVSVWERGVGMTLACGTGACASYVASILNGYLSSPQGEVILPGGKLGIEWPKKNHIYLTGPAEKVFSGRIHLRD